MITFAYITSREIPHWEWYISAIYKQCYILGIDYEVIIVDEHINKDREQEVLGLVGGRFKFKHVAPKPNVWSGKYRLTPRNHVSISNARNTAICYSSGDHIVFSDDVGVLGGNFVKYHLEAADKKIIMAGIQHKVTKLIVIAGETESFGESNVDSRESCEDGLRLADDPAWIYGNNFSLPTEFALEVNGVDEIYDGQYGVEDCDFGIRLNNAGHDIYINKSCLYVESREAHIDRDLYQKKAKEIDGRHANESIIFKCRDEKRVWTIGNNFNLMELRNHILSGGQFPIPTEPTIDWRDGSPLYLSL